MTGQQRRLSNWFGHHAVQLLRGSLLAAASFALAGSTISCAHKQPVAGPVIVPVGSFLQAWTFPLGWDRQHDAVRSMYLRDGVLYVYSDRNTVAAINPASGRPLFATQINPGGIPLHPPVSVRDNVAFPSANLLEVYNKKGKRIQHIELGHSIRSGGVAAADTVYLGLDYPNGGRLAAVDIGKPFGNTRWELMTFGGVQATPAVHANVIYAGSEDGRVYAVGPDRLGIWPLDQGSYFQTDGKVSADIRADDQGVYVASTDTKLYCLELGTGKIKWQYYASTPLSKPVETTPTMVYLPVDGVGIVAISKTEGKYNREAKWTLRGATQFLSEDETFAYLLAAGGRIVAVEKSTGTIRFHSQRSDLSIFATNPNPKDSTIYAAQKDGLVIAIRPITKPGSVGDLVRANDWIEEAIASAQ